MNFDILRPQYLAASTAPIQAFSHGLRVWGSGFGVALWSLGSREIPCICPLEVHNVHHPNILMLVILPRYFDRGGKAGDMWFRPGCLRTGALQEALI